jgi:peptidoglycan/LPS O-acetylase OafA/YrhL
LGLLRNFALVSAVSIAFGAVTYRFIEKPSLTYARRFKASK